MIGVVRILEVQVAQGEVLDALVESTFAIRRRVETDAELRDRALSFLEPKSMGSRAQLERVVRRYLQNMMPAGASAEALEWDLAAGWILREKPKGFFRRAIWALKLGLFFFRGNLAAGILQHAASRGLGR